MTNILKNKTTFTLVLGSLLAASVLLGYMTMTKTPGDSLLLQGSVDKHYTSVQELTSDSVIVAKMKVTDSKVFEYEKVPFTLNTAKVTEVYKGDKKTEINILETGGTINGKNYAFEKNEVLKKDQDAIVYLTKYDGPVTKDAYVITGVFAGKFKLDANGKVVKDEEKNGELKEVKDIKDLKLK